MNKDAARRRFDVVMAWSVDRLGRSLQDLIAFMQELRSLKIDLFLHQQGLDTTTPAGKMMFQVLGSFAEYERDMIRARVNAGIARAKAAGKHCGRPPWPLSWRRESVRHWQFLGGLAYGSLPSGSASIHRQCSASAALSMAQAAPWRSR